MNSVRDQSQFKGYFCKPVCRTNTAGLTAAGLPKKNHINLEKFVASLQKVGHDRVKNVVD